MNPLYDKSDYLFNRKEIELLRRIRNQRNKIPLMRLGRDVYYTYPIILNKIKTFEQIGLIISNKSGRSRYAQITDKGKEVLKMLEELEILYDSDKS